MLRRASAVVLAAILLFSAAAGFNPANAAWPDALPRSTQSSQPSAGHVPPDTSLDSNPADLSQPRVTSVDSPTPLYRGILITEFRPASSHVHEFRNLTSTTIEHLHAFRI